MTDATNVPVPKSTELDKDLTQAFVFQSVSAVLVARANEHTEYLANLYLSGKTVNMYAKETGANESRVRWLLAKYNLPTIRQFKETFEHWQRQSAGETQNGSD